MEILDPCDVPSLGRVLEISESQAVIQVLEGTTGLSNKTLRARFLGESFRLPVSQQMLGRVYSMASVVLQTEVRPRSPRTGVTSTEFSIPIPGVTCVNSSRRAVCYRWDECGPKLPIFSGNGLPHDRVSAQIVRQARLLEEKSVLYSLCGHGREARCGRILHP